MENASAILKTLDPLFKEAEEKGLWFHCNYQNLWFSPKELKEQHKKGSFIWGGTNWNLRNPRELIAEAQAKVSYAQQALEDVKKRVLTTVHGKMD